MLPLISLTVSSAASSRTASRLACRATADCTHGSGIFSFAVSSAFPSHSMAESSSRMCLAGLANHISLSLSVGWQSTACLGASRLPHKSIENWLYECSAAGTGTPSQPSSPGPACSSPLTLTDYSSSGSLPRDIPCETATTGLLRSSRRCCHVRNFRHS